MDEQQVNELADKLDDELSFSTKKKKKKAKLVDADAVAVSETTDACADTLSKENVDASGFTYDMVGTCT